MNISVNSSAVSSAMLSGRLSQTNSARSNSNNISGNANAAVASADSSSLIKELNEAKITENTEKKETQPSQTEVISAIKETKRADISKNNITGDRVVKYFDLEGNKVTQIPPEQYMKSKEILEMTGRYFDKTV